jgi:hypothetical protein
LGRDILIESVNKTYSRRKGNSPHATKSEGTLKENWKPGRREHIVSFIIGIFIFLVIAGSIFVGVSRTVKGERGIPAVFPLLFFLGLLLIAIGTALLAWIYHDSLNRGMPSPAVWLLLVILIPIIGLLLYFLVRPSGRISICENCGKKRLEILVECPHCRYRVDSTLFRKGRDGRITIHR